LSGVALISEDKSHPGGRGDPFAQLRVPGTDAVDIQVAIFILLPSVHLLHFCISGFISYLKSETHSAITNWRNDGISGRMFFAIG
jgi:hypothetical protein